MNKSYLRILVSNVAKSTLYCLLNTVNICVIYTQVVMTPSKNVNIKDKTHVYNVQILQRHNNRDKNNNKELYLELILCV